MTTMQIARAKERYLENALNMISPAVKNGDVATSLLEDFESLVRDTIDLFATLQRCDEQHSLLAATVEDYPYQETEAELAALFRRFLSTCDELRVLGEVLQSKGHELESQRTLDSVCAHTRRLVYNDQTFYGTETYRTIAERAETEYQSGQVEEWPA